MRYWLLYYSLPLLLNILPPLYWHHYALLVCALHILLSDSISSAQVDAAECMLLEFCALLPDLYGETSCTANAHLLSHLAKYVRLWGPLWTHSAFGFENKNGRLKHFVHGNSDILQQLLFNIDVCYTLQHLHTYLLEHESEETLHYLEHSVPRSNMKGIGNQSYIIGKYQLANPTEEQSVALGHTRSIEVFSRLLKDGIVYHSSSYKRALNSKRNNTNCCYKDSAGNICFGRIELFVNAPKACALLRQLQPLGTSLYSTAGHPCRDTLKKYSSADLLTSNRY